MAKGSRGGKRGSQAVVNKGQAIADFEKKRGITISQDLKNRMTTDNLYDATKRIDDMMDSYPGYFSTVKEIEDYSFTSSYAGMRTDGEVLYLNSKYYNDPKLMEAMYSYDVSLGFHPAGTTHNDIITHELGHAVSDKIAINNHLQPEYANLLIVGRAANEIRANSKSYGYTRKPSEKKLRTEISKYATKNYNETVAEAFADYHANKENAKPLSKAIMKEINRIMGSK